MANKKEEVVIKDYGREAAKELCKNKHVYNSIEPVEFYVSTGSLNLDVALGGKGVFPGITRLVGASMGGKTSCGFQIMENAFETRRRCRGVYIKTERLTAKMRERIGVKTTLKPDEWDNHTCLIVECNVYEVNAQFILDLIVNNFKLPVEEREQFVFIVDSLDFLILEADLAKSFQDSHKVAGPQVISKKLMTKCLLPLIKGGHIGLFISQVTAAPKIDPYAPDAPRIAPVSGGNSLIHSADNILEFCPRYNGDYILEDPDQKYIPGKNERIGHNVPIILRKSDDEQYGKKITYPIKYGRKNGKSVWAEREVVEYCLGFGIFSKKGAWITPSEQVKEELRAVNLEIPEQIHGLDKLYQLFEDRNDLTQFFFNKFRILLNPTMFPSIE